jgi:F-type H+-transporting ATPase subunit beta
MKGNTGTILAIRGQIIEVDFPDKQPQMHHIITVMHHPSIKMEVALSSSASQHTYYCLALSSTQKIAQGDTVINTEKTIEIPVGNEVLGRVMNAFGDVLDKGETLHKITKRSIFSPMLAYKDIVAPKHVITTGIKALDFFAPILKGGKIGIFGGAGVGKTVLLSEIIHNIVIKH